MVEETVTIAIKANVTAFKKAMNEAKQSVGKTGRSIKDLADRMADSMKKAGESAKNSGFSAFAESIKGISPVTDKAIGTIEDMKDRFSKAGKAGKAAMGLVAVAVAGLAVGIAVKLGQAIMDTTGKLAKMADPMRFDKATSEMKESIRTLKTALGSLASPIFEWMAKAVTTVANALTWVVEKVYALVGILQGLFGISSKANESLSDMAGSMEEAGAAADAGLASFDKLNTLDVGEMGDMSQVEKMESIIANARKEGEKLAKKIKEAFSPLTGFIDKLKNLDLKKIWGDFKEWAIDAWDGIVEYFGGIWESVKGAVLGLWDSFSQKVTEAWDWLLTKATEVWNTISTFILGLWDSFTEKVTGAWDWVLTKSTEVWESVKGFVLGLWDSFKEKVSEAWEACLSRAKESWEAIKTFVFGIWDSIKDYFLGKFQEAIDGLQGMFDGLWNGVRSAWDRVYAPISSAVDWLIDKVEWLLNKINSAKSAVSGAIGKVTDKVGGFFGGVADKVGGVLGFANGGVFQPNDPKLVMVGDNRSEKEVISPLSTMKQAFKEAVSEMGGGSRRTIEIALTMDGKVLARAIYDDIQAEGNRRGTVT